MWTVTKAELESKGESLDYATLIPPEVPDQQNLGALPLFRLEPDPADKGSLKPLALQSALENIASSDYRLPPGSRMVKGEMADLEAISENITKRYNALFKPQPNAPSPSTLAELEALCPALAEIRSAALTRPFCRFPQDYTSMPPYARPLGLSTKLITLAQAFDLHAILALHAKQPGLALDDMKTLFKIDEDLRREPVLVTGLVAAGIEALQVQAIWEGIALHAWNDTQLSELQESLKNVEFFSTYQLCIRGEAVGFFVPMMDQEERHLKITDIAGMSNGQDSASEDIRVTAFFTLVVWLAPRGWFSLSKSAGVTLFYKAADECADPATRRFYPQVSDSLAQQVRPVSLISPGDIFRRVIMGPILDSSSAFAQTQFQVDAARLACISERYRLIHGSYPDSIGTLAAFSTEDIPSDIVNGAPYHYILQPNGSFLIYSVGWDLKDDGGKRAFKPDDPKSPDRKHGDWPWPALVSDAQR